MRAALRWVGRLLGALLVSIALAVVAGLGYRAWLQSQTARALALDTSEGIDEPAFIDVGSTEQWLWIRSRKRGNPVLLIVHGGPGNTTSTIAAGFVPFERDYTVVHWDQAGAGKTFARSGALDPSLSIQSLVQDGIAVTEYLREHLSAERVIVLGWSWGSLIGLEMVRARPELFTAYVGTGQIVDMQRGEALAYQRVLAEARRRANPRAIADLQAIGAPPYDAPREVGVQRAWAAEFEGSGNLLLGLLRAVAAAPHHSLTDGFAYLRGLLASQAHFLGAHLDGPLMAVDLGRQDTTFALPMFVIDGAEDNYTPAALAREYFDTLTAPRKAFTAIPGAGHLALLTHTEDFRQALEQQVRPLLVSAD